MRFPSLSRKANKRKVILIYGATGFTGRLIAERLVTSDQAPIVAGRTASRVEALAAELEAPRRTFSLGEPGDINKALADVDVVVNAAGPFTQTAVPLIEAAFVRALITSTSAANYRYFRLHIVMTSSRSDAAS